MDEEKKTVKDLQEFQDEHDKKFHEKIFNLEKNERLRHMAQHLTKISGKFAEYFDKLDHGEPESEKILEEIKEKRLPDLFAFSLIISNIFKIDLEEAYFKRIKEFEKEKIE